MNTRTRHIYRRKLFALRDRLAHEVADLEFEPTLRTASPASVSSDLGDASVSLYEDLVSCALVENETNMLREVNDALGRLQEGNFGTCELCRRAIPSPRLHAVPYTRLCAACARTPARG